MMGPREPRSGSRAPWEQSGLGVERLHILGSRDWVRGLEHDLPLKVSLLLMACLASGMRRDTMSTAVCSVPLSTPAHGWGTAPAQLLASQVLDLDLSVLA